MRSRLRTLLLFDLDGTLISGSCAGATAYVKAIETCHDIKVSLAGIQFCGKTDLQNLAEILARHGLDPQQAGDERLLATYLHHLQEAVRLDPGVVCPGIRSLLDTLAGLDWVYPALGTGNLEPGAQIKLAVHGLDGSFATGGFGSDAAERAEAIAAGVARAERYYGTEFARVVVVGDTPLDVACAQANGFHSIAVATGRYCPSELEEAGATVVLPDLTQTDAFLAAVAALPPTGRTHLLAAPGGPVL